MPARILASERAVGPEIEALGREFELVHEPDLWRTPEELRRRVAESDALLVRNQTLVDAALLEAGSAARGGRLKIVGRLGVGLETVDMAAASATVWPTWSPHALVEPTTAPRGSLTPLS